MVPMLAMVNALVPFVSVKLDELEEPTVTEPKALLAGLKVTDEFAAPPIPVNVAV